MFIVLLKRKFMYGSADVREIRRTNREQLTLNQSCESGKKRNGDEISINQSEEIGKKWTNVISSLRKRRGESRNLVKEGVRQEDLLYLPCRVKE